MRDGITRMAFGDTSDEVARSRFRSSRVKSAPLVVSRQATASLLAFRAFTTAEQARAFLHSYHDELNGRPFEIAGACDGGLKRVQNAIETCALAGAKIDT